MYSARWRSIKYSWVFLSSLHLYAAHYKIQLCAKRVCVCMYVFFSLLISYIVFSFFSSAMFLCNLPSKRFVSHLMLHNVPIASIRLLLVLRFTHSHSHSAFSSPAIKRIHALTDIILHSIFIQMEVYRTILSCGFSVFSHNRGTQTNE